jgi:hypothetical protein
MEIRRGEGTTFLTKIIILIFQKKNMTQSIKSIVTLNMAADFATNKSNKSVYHITTLIMVNVSHAVKVAGK